MYYKKMLLNQVRFLMLILVLVVVRVTLTYNFTICPSSFTKKKKLFKEGANWRRKWQPTPVFLPGKVHGQRSLAGCSPWGYMTEHVCMRVEGDGLVAINW